MATEERPLRLHFELRDDKPSGLEKPHGTREVFFEEIF